MRKLRESGADFFRWAAMPPATVGSGLDYVEFFASREANLRIWRFER
jgi:hypothetical protein